MRWLAFWPNTRPNLRPSPQPDSRPSSSPDSRPSPRLAAPPARPRPACRGATLAELATVLAVAAVVSAVAAPNLQTLLTSQQLKAASSELLDAIAHTRAQAIARNQRVKLMPRDPGGADWTRGWTVFVDRDGDRQPGPLDELIAVHGPLPDGLRILFSFSSSAPPQYIAYNGAGRSCGDTSSGASRPGTLSLFHGGQARRIKINMLGRIRLCNPARDEGCEGAAAPP